MPDGLLTLAFYTYSSAFQINTNSENNEGSKMAQFWKHVVLLNVLCCNIKRNLEVTHISYRVAHCSYFLESRQSQGLGRDPDWELYEFQLSVFWLQGTAQSWPAPVVIIWWCSYGVSYRSSFSWLLGQIFLPSSLQQGPCEPSSGRFLFNTWPFGKPVPFPARMPSQ